MRRFLLIFSSLLLVLSCAKNSSNQYKELPQKDTILTESKSVIESVCQEVESYSFTEEEIKEWEEMNISDAFLLIRGAERHLDTIVNHVHIIFITEP